MEGLLNANIKQVLEEIITHCFYINRMADRIVSILSVKFVMNNTGELYHKSYAHWAPLFADEISEYMDARNCTTVYGETPIGNQNYDSPLDCFNKTLDMNIELELLLKKAIIMAREENDYTTMVFLEDELKSLVPKTKDILLLIDKMEYYGESPKDWMNFDKDIKSFGIFGE